MLGVANLTSILPKGAGALGLLASAIFGGLIADRFLSSDYGPPDRSAAQGNLCHEASTQMVATASATGSIDNSPGGTHTGRTSFDHLVGAGDERRWDAGLTNAATVLGVSVVMILSADGRVLTHLRHGRFRIFAAHVAAPSPISLDALSCFDGQN
jgi:hypothetical protein